MCQGIFKSCYDLYTGSIDTLIPQIFVQEFSTIGMNMNLLIYREVQLTMLITNTQCILHIYINEGKLQRTMHSPGCLTRYRRTR